MCQCVNAQAFVEVAGSQILRCRTCESVFTDPSAIKLGIYVQDYFTGEYETDYSDSGLIQMSCVRFEEHLALIRRLTTGRRLLDVGCALGLFMEMAHEAGLEASGFDVSEYAAAECRRNLRLEVLSGDLATAYAGRCFDVITLFHLLEHVGDPIRYLKERIKPLMSGHGVLAIEVPNLNSLEARVAGATWVDLRPDQHAIHYTPNTLKMVLKEAGFRVIHQSTRTWLTSRTGLVGACAALVGRKPPRLQEPALHAREAPPSSRWWVWWKWQEQLILGLRSVNRIALVPLYWLISLVARVQGAVGLGKNVLAYATAATDDSRRVSAS